MKEGDWMGEDFRKIGRRRMGDKGLEDRQNKGLKENLGGREAEREKRIQRKK